jgi:hypothetical protein
MAATEAIRGEGMRHKRAMQARATGFKRDFGDADVDIFLLLFLFMALLDAVLEVLVF